MPIEEPHEVVTHQNEHAPVIVFMHIGKLGRWSDILQDQWATFQHSGLIDEADAFYYGIVGENGPEVSTIIDHPKATQLYHDPDPKWFELLTFQHMRLLCAKNPTARVLYLHTKGASHVNPHVHLWRRMLEYWMIYCRAECLSLLEHFDTVGVNLHNDGNHDIAINSEEHCWHYSGNFWWARAAHVARLPEIPERLVRTFPSWYWLVERLVLQPLPSMRAAELFRTQHQHYYGISIRPELYVHQPIQVNTIDASLQHTPIDDHHLTGLVPQPSKDPLPLHASLTRSGRGLLSDRKHRSAGDHQIEVYLQALQLVKSKNFRTIVEINCDISTPLVTYLRNYDTVGYASPVIQEQLRQKFPDRTWRTFDPDIKTSLPTDLLMCADAASLGMTLDRLVDFIHGFEWQILLLGVPLDGSLHTLLDSTGQRPAGQMDNAQLFVDLLAKGLGLSSFRIINGRQTALAIFEQVLID